MFKKKDYFKGTEIKFQLCSPGTVLFWDILHVSL